MSIDHPHVGGDDEFRQKIEALKKASEELWSAAIEKMASVEGSVRTGVRFSLYSRAGKKIDEWQTGDLDHDDAVRYQGHADNKCLAMLKTGRICSGIVANAEAVPPVYDGGIQIEDGLYLACSGLRAELDRVYCIHVAQSAEMLPQLRYNTIMQQSPSEALVRTLHAEAGLYMVAHAFSLIKK